MEPHNTDTFGAEQKSASGQSTHEDVRQRMSAAATEVQSAVRQQAESLKRDAQDRSKEFLEDKKNFAAGELSDVAEALRSSASSLRQKQHDQAGRYVNLAADSIEHFAGLLRQKDVVGLAQDAGELARRQPGAFLGGAVAAGFLLSRFLKASAQRDHEADEHSAQLGEDPQAPRSPYAGSTSASGSTSATSPGTTSGTPPIPPKTGI